MEHKCGDVVKTKTEAVLMTVESVTGPWMVCVWFPKNEAGEYVGDLQTAVYHEYALEKVR